MLSDEENEKYEKEFNKFDASKNGMISDRDFFTKVKESDDNLTQKEIK